jgi:hypothetical protein
MSNHKRIKAKNLPGIRQLLISEQDNKCALCNIDLSNAIACVDHDHKTGIIRSVLCLNCNGIEGKIFNLARRAKRASTEMAFVEKIIEYWRRWSETASSRWLHPNHKTEDEKRISRNRKARLRRIRKKSK